MAFGNMAQMLAEAERRRKLGQQETFGVGAAITKPPVAGAVTPTMTALTTPATAQTTTAPVNPFTGEAAKTASANYWQTLQPQIRKATDAVTSSVNPFMTGNVGASLLRDVQQPALQGLSQFETSQAGKAQDWEAQQITETENKKQQNIANLKELANSPNATPQDIENYRAALEGRAATTVGGGTGTTTGTLTPAQKADIQSQITALQSTPDYLGDEATVARLNDLTYQLLGTRPYKYSAAAKKAADVAANKDQYLNAANAYKQLSGQIPDWITDPNNSMRASYQAFQDLEDLADKADSGTASLDELTKLNTLIAAFKKGGTAGNYNEAAFESLGYGTKSAGTTGKTIMLNQNTAVANYPGMPGYNPLLPIKYF